MREAMQSYSEIYVYDARIHLKDPSKMVHRSTEIRMEKGGKWKEEIVTVAHTRPCMRNAFARMLAAARNVALTDAMNVLR